MKKILCLASLVLALVSSSSQAFIQFSFQTDLANANALLNNGGSPLAGGSLVLLFWSSDTSVGFNNVDPYSPTSGDQLLGLISTDEYGTGAFPGEALGNTTLSFGSGGVQYGGGYVYAAVFDQLYTQGNPNPTITAGTHYNVGPTMAVIERWNYSGQPPGPEDYGALMDATPIQTSLVVAAVPEPSTVGLLLVGAGLVALRRFRRG